MPADDQLVATRQRRLNRERLQPGNQMIEPAKQLTPRCHRMRQIATLALDLIRVEEARSGVAHVKELTGERGLACAVSASDQHGLGSMRHERTASDHARRSASSRRDEQHGPPNVSGRSAAARRAVTCCGLLGGVKLPP